MKRFRLITFLPMVALVSVSTVYAVPPEAQDKAGREIIESVNDINSLNSEVKKVGMAPDSCLSCNVKTADLNVTLDKSDIDLGNPWYRKDGQPYVIYLKRTAKTPAKLNMKFKNGYEYCEKMYVGPNAWGGNIIMGCMLSLTRYVDEEISLNLKNLPKLKEGEEEIIEVKLTKQNIKKAKYEVEVKHLSNSTMKEDIGKKFFGDGYNVSFEAN